MKAKYLFFTGIFMLFLLAVKAQNETISASLNPFSFSTELTIYDLSNDTVTFEIFNQTGRLITRFYSSQVLSGTVTVTFAADTLPNGLYFAILTKNSNNSAIKLLKDQTITHLDEAQSNSTSIVLYPNPTTSSMTFFTELEVHEIRIYTLEGELLQTSSGQKNTVDFNNIDNGVYLIHIKTKNKVFVKKVWKK
jgi:hypothetical protein